jgi:hypothetical protein
VSQLGHESYRQEPALSLQYRTSKSLGNGARLHVPETGAALEEAESGKNGRCFRAVLVREPANPDDEGAIAVYASGIRLGYLRPRASGPPSQATLERGSGKRAKPWLVSRMVPFARFGALLPLRVRYEPTVKGRDESER